MCTACSLYPDFVLAAHVQVNHEIMMVGCTTYQAPGSGTSTPVYIVKNEWGTGPNGAL